MDLNRVAFFGLTDLSPQLRLIPAAQAMAGAGRKVKIAKGFTSEDIVDHDLLIFSHPHQDPTLLEAIEVCIRGDKRVVIDLALDYHRLPSDHPYYKKLGRGNPNALKELEKILSKVDLVTVPTQLLAEQYAEFSQQIEVIPDAWSRKNPFWDKPAQVRPTLNVGLVSTQTTKKDCVLLKQTLARIIREFPDTSLVIAGDPGLLEVFPAVPEDRRMFVPLGSVEDYPYALAAFDILLVPQRDKPFNQTLSDRPLMEAGVRRIPWIASPLPGYREWSAGGFFAEKQGDWYTHLKTLISDQSLRTSLGAQGREKAETRAAGLALNRWEHVFHQVSSPSRLS